MLPAAYVALNLSAVRHNLIKAKEYAPQAKIMAVIKANAYGHGLARIAEQLGEADAFAVARVEEGIRLRKAGFTLPIALLEGFTCPEELRDMLLHDLDAVIHCPEQIEILRQHSGHEKISVWLKVDSGMNRLGFKGHAVDAAYQALRSCPLVQKPLRLMTHLASADDRGDNKTLQQLQNFNLLTQGYSEERSIANSAGILGWPASHSDWVRPGVMLYGISPFSDKNGTDFGLKPIMGLFSRLIAVKQINPGETLGYAGNWICDRETYFGVVAIGYGDGYPRNAKSGTPVLVNGKRVPLIGRVSMDMITVNLNELPDAKPGDPVELWGENLAVEEIARYANTIPYTLLCGITQRVQIVERD